MRNCIILWAWFIFAIQLQAQVAFKATTDATSVVENGVFSVEFVLENAKGSNFVAPKFEHFDVLNGPSVSQSSTFVNGKGSSSVGYRYSLMAKKTGTLKIKPASIRVNGKTMTSQPLSIKVVKNDGKNIQNGLVMPTDEDIFLRIEIDTVPIHPGQQCILNYRIYTSLNIREFSTLEEDKYKQFFSRYLRNFDRKAKQVVVNGRQYTSQLIKSVALFPQKTGEYSINPMVLNVWIPKPGQSSRSFFSRSSTINKRISSESLIISVVPIPDDAPPSFSNGVGQFAMRATANLKSITTDDALVLEMTVKGNGDPKRWSAPDLNLKDKFEVYDPNTTYDESDEESGQLMSLKKFEYLMIPKKTGRIIFQVPFTYYNPERSKFETILSPRISVNVTEGSKRDLEAIEDLQDQNAFNIDALMPIKRLSKGSGSFLFSPLYFVFFFLPFLFLGYTWYQHKDDGLFEQLDPAERRRRVANEKALLRLEEANKLLQAESGKAFYESISTAIFGYISDKLQIQTSELSKETISRRIDELDVSPSRKDELMEILRTCERNVYGGVGDGAKSELYNQTLELITELEAAIGE